MSYRVRSFGMITIRVIQDHSEYGRSSPGTDESLSTVDSSVRLIYHDPSDLGSLILIRIISKERSLNKACLCQI